MDFLLKQRLVGAIVLVALGVIFIPMLLEGPDETLVPKMEELPEFADPRPGEPFEAFPSSGAMSDEPETSVVTEEAPSEPDLPETAPEPEPALLPETAASAQTESTPPPEVASPATTATQAAEPGPLGSWVVQVGSFSSQQNALVLRDKLREGGFPTQVEKVQVDSKTHYRVRVGPFLERAEADRNQRQLSDKFSLTARVLSYP
ncbi:MAG: SPOR domain-containing protein [Thiogranum sp.]|nr:SPOR domain-containing protein [Thiogranum sp.]